MMTETERRRIEARIECAKEHKQRWAGEAQRLQKQLRDKELQRLDRKERTHLLCRLGGLVCLAGAADQATGRLALTEARIAGLLALALREEGSEFVKAADTLGSEILAQAAAEAEERRRKRAEKRAAQTIA